MLLLFSQCAYMYAYLSLNDNRCCSCRHVLPVGFVACHVVESLRRLPSPIPMRWSRSAFGWLGLSYGPGRLFRIHDFTSISMSMSMSMGTRLYRVHTRKYPVITHFSDVGGWQMTFTLMRVRKSLRNFFMWNMLGIFCGMWHMWHTSDRFATVSTIC